MGFFEFLANICRTYTDLLHIFSYLLLIIGATILAYYKFDKNSFMSYYYKFIKILIVKKSIDVKTISLFNIINYYILTLNLKLTSNRLPYINKINSNKVIKFFKSWFK